jgi:hypothetical protein
LSNVWRARTGAGLVGRLCAIDHDRELAIDACDRALVKAGRKAENPRVSPSLAVLAGASAGKHFSRNLQLN